MRYVKSVDVVNRFIKYLKEYGSELISKDIVIEELYDVLDSVDSIDIEDKSEN